MEQSLGGRGTLVVELVVSDLPFDLPRVATFDLRFATRLTLLRLI